MITGILLTPSSAARVIARAVRLGAIESGAKIQAHHVTLALGTTNSFIIGQVRTVTATHIGFIEGPEGSAYAFRVVGAADSKNETPHVTIATYGNAKPAMSNLITAWTQITPFDLSGEIAIF